MRRVGCYGEELRLVVEDSFSCLRTSGQVVDDSRVDVDGGDVVGRRKKELRVHFGREYLCVFADYAKPQSGWLQQSQSGRRNVTLFESHFSSSPSVAL
jgi:hypothetical protein